VAPEIPRIYSMKGAEIVLHLTSGMSNSGGGIRAPGATEAALQAAAWHNCIYMVNSNWALELGAYYPKARISGDSCAFDYTGNELVRAPDSNEQILRAKIDIEACRKYRQQFFNNYVTVIRTELYAPFYNKPIYPPNQFLRDGAPTTALDEKRRSCIMQTKENLKKLEDYYSEDIVN
jgi:predicted amidohydrolase